MAKVVSNILMKFGHGDIAVFALLNCFAAFDTTTHNILFRFFILCLNHVLILLLIIIIMMIIIILINYYYYYF